jgi:hypothetical protein
MRHEPKERRHHNIHGIHVIMFKDVVIFHQIDYTMTSIKIVLLPNSIEKLGAIPVVLQSLASKDHVTQLLVEK